MFHIDKEFGKTYESPDHKIQHIMNIFTDVEKATIEGLVSPTPTNKKNSLRIVGNNKQKLKTDNNGIDDDAVTLRIINFSLISFPGFIP